MNAHNEMQTLVFYDGACPICNAEMHTLRRWDHAAHLSLIDIAAPDFNESAWPVSIAQMNARLHARLPDGTWRTGMAATRPIYRAVGRGWMVAFTGWPLLSRVFDRAYARFARNRLPLSARFAKAGLFTGAKRCIDGACRIPH